MKRMLSGIQPSNKITLGNYLGAIKQYINYQNEYESFIFVADLHVITNPDIDYKKIFENKKMAVCFYQACGLDLKKTHVFYQSDIPAHTELEHVLMCNAKIGELNRMTQFKDKSQKFAKSNGTESIPAGLFEYPVLMASDILLYDADIVPVGADQKQHLELTQILAERMNKKYGNLFTLPKPFIPKTGARIMDLLNPTSKMSKSATNEKGTIFLLDDIEAAKKKIMGAKTDCLNKVKFDPENQPGISNLIAIYNAISGISISEIEKKYENCENYGIFKKDLAEIVAKLMTEIQSKYYDSYKNYESIIKPILIENAKYVNKIANAKVDFVYKKIGMREE